MCTTVCDDSQQQTWEEVIKINELIRYHKIICIYIYNNREEGKKSL